MSKGTSYIIGGGGAAAVIIAIIGVVSFTGNEVEIGMQIDNIVEEDKIKVFASFYPYYEFTKNVAGNKADVRQFLPSNVEAHDWEPRAGDIQLLQNADVFIYNGLGIEPYVDNMINSGEFDNVMFVVASKGVDTIKPEEGHDDHDSHTEEFAEEIEHIVEDFEHGHIDASHALDRIEEILHKHEGDGHDHGNETIEKIEAALHEIEEGRVSPDGGIEEIHHVVLDIEGDAHGSEDEHGHHHDFEFDPHIWLDPILIKQQVNNIRDGLIEADPQNREHYEQNAKLYNQKLDALDMKIKSSMSSCAKDTIVPFHNAFTYLGERYDFKIMALGGISPESEATAAEIAEFVEFVKDNDIKVIFSEELVDPRLAEVIANEAGAQVLVFSPLEALTSEETYEKVTFLEKMEQNLDSLKVALECQ